ncbi:MAG: hypothetical protein ABIE36_02280 [Candidatus Diapherotrites archaeon]
MDYSQEVERAQEISKVKTHKWIWFTVFGVLFIGIFLIIYFVLIGSQKNISEDRLVQGSSVQIGTNNSVKLKFGDEDHNIKINFVGLDSVDLTISSDPIHLNLKINEVREIDLDNDGIADLKIKLVSITNGKATIAFKKIEKEVCLENWNCSKWGNCFNGFQRRNCIDLNSCGTIQEKPAEREVCLEIKFIENDSAFDEGENDSLNNTPIGNWTNQTNFTREDPLITNNSQNTSLSNFLGEPIFYFNCNKNISLFINASNNCTPFNIVCTSVADLFGIGVVQKTITYFELKGMQNEKCRVYFKYENVSIYYTPQLIQILLDSAITLKEINSKLNQTNEEYKFLIGKNSTCYYPVSNWLEVVSGWNEDSFSGSSEDVEEYNCTGSLYD